MTTRERAIRLIQTLPETASLEEIVDKLQRLEPETPPHNGAEQERPSTESEGGVWDLLEEAAGTVEMPPDWASEHDHYLYGSPKRSSAA